MDTNAISGESTGMMYYHSPLFGKVNNSLAEQNENIKNVGDPNYDPNDPYSDSSNQNNSNQI